MVIVRAVFALGVLVPALATADPSGYTAALHAGAQTTSLHWLRDIGSPPAPGPLLDVEAGWRDEVWSVVGFGAYSQIQSTGVDLEDPLAIITYDVTNRFVDAGARARVEGRGWFVGAGLAYERLGERGTYTGRRASDPAPVTARADDWASGVMTEVQVGFAFPWLAPCSCRIELTGTRTSTLAIEHIGADSFRVALGVRWVRAR